MIVIEREEIETRGPEKDLTAALMILAGRGPIQITAEEARRARPARLVLAKLEDGGLEIGADFESADVSGCETGPSDVIGILAARGPIQISAEEARRARPAGLLISELTDGGLEISLEPIARGTLRH